MTTATTVPTSPGSTPKSSAPHERTRRSSSADPSATAVSETSGSTGGPITSFLDILQGLVTAIGITAKATRSSDAEPSRSGNGISADEDGPTALDAEAAASPSVATFVPPGMFPGAVATHPAANRPLAGEASGDPSRSAKIPAAGVTAVGTLSTETATSSALPLVGAASSSQGQLTTISSLVGEPSTTTNLGDPSQTTSEDAARFDRPDGTMDHPNGGGVETSPGAAPGRRERGDGSFPRHGLPAPVGVGQANVVTDPRTPIAGGANDGPGRPYEPNFTSATTLHSPTAFGPNGSVLERDAGSQPTVLTTVDATAPGNAGMTGLAPSSTAWSAVTNTPAAPVLADLPPGHFGAPPEVARAVPSQILPHLDRLAPNGAALVLRLDPPALGSVVLRVVAGEGRRVRLHFQVEDPAVGNALAEGWDQLESALRAQGLLPEGFTVDLDDSRHPSRRNDQDASSSGDNASSSEHRDVAAPTVNHPAANIQVASVGGSGRYIDFRL